MNKLFKYALPLGVMLILLAGWVINEDANLITKSSVSASSPVTVTRNNTSLSGQAMVLTYLEANSAVTAATINVIGGATTIASFTANPNCLTQSWPCEIYIPRGNTLTVIATNTNTYNAISVYVSGYMRRP